MDRLIYTAMTGAKHILDMAVDVGLMPPMAGFIEARTGVAA